MTKWAGILGGGAAAAAVGAGLYVSGVFAPDVPNPEPQQAAVVPEPAQEPVAAPKAEPEAEPEAPAEPAVVEIAPPSFDVVRIEPDGSALIAGSGAAGAVVRVLLDRAEIGSSKAGGDGKFVSLLDLEPSDQPRMMSLSMEVTGQEYLSETEIIVAPFGIEEKLALAEIEPEPEPQPEVVTEPEAALESDDDVPAEADEGVTEAAPVAEEVATPETPDAPVAEDVAASDTVQEPDVVAPPAAEPVVDPVVEEPAPEVAEVAPEVTEPEPEVAEQEQAPVQAPVVAQVEPTESEAIEQENVTEVVAENSDPAPAAVSPPEPDIAVEEEAVETVVAEVVSPIAEDVPEEAAEELAAIANDVVAESEPVEDEAVVEEAVASDVDTDVVATEETAAPEPEIAGVTTEAVESAPEAPEPEPEPAPEPEPEAPPTLLASDQEGVRVLTGPDVLDSVAIDTISYDHQGDVALAGRGVGSQDGGFVRVYLDNSPITTSRIREDGSWRVQLPEVDKGVYTLRVDEVDDDGKVKSRTETPFKREDRDTLERVAEKEGTEGSLSIITVQPGNTLWQIARERYGEGLLYVRVFDANRKHIRNPDLIYPGQVFDLPEKIEQ